MYVIVKKSLSVNFLVRKMTYFVARASFYHIIILYLHLFIIASQAFSNAMLEEFGDAYRAPKIAASQDRVVRQVCYSGSKKRLASTASDHRPHNHFFNRFDLDIYFKK